MDKKKDVLITDSLKDLFDIEMAFTRIEALSNILLEYVVDNSELNTPEDQDTANFTLMAIRDYAKFYSDQVQNLDIVNGKLKPLKAAE